MSAVPVEPEPTDYLDPQPPRTAPASDALLSVRDLRVSFATEAGALTAVDGVSFDIAPGEVVAVVGESGCGKSVTSLAVMGLLPRPSGRIDDGEVLFKGEDLVTARPERLRDLRGDRLSMIFQDPLTALNPVQRVGAQIVELIRAHRSRVSKTQARQRALELLDIVGIPNAERRIRDYPHQFSGGMRQRVMIAMAMALEPDLLIADEPTTALDVTVQAQILEVLLEVRARMNMAILLITHDLGVVAEVAERVMVMYAGKKVEEASAEDLFNRPRHPYTWGLLGATTRTDQPRQARLQQIEGAPPNLLRPPVGCRFAPRCRYSQDVCRATPTEIGTVGVDHVAACHFARRPDWTPELTPAEFSARLAEGR